MERRIWLKSGDVGSVPCNTVQRDCMEYDWGVLSVSCVAIVAVKDEANKTAAWKPSLTEPHKGRLQAECDWTRTSNLAPYCSAYHCLEVVTL
jgi:hypothetical protein